MGIGENRIKIEISDKGIFLDRPVPYIQSSSDQLETLLYEVAQAGIDFMMPLLKKGFKERGFGEYPGLET